MSLIMGDTYVMPFEINQTDLLAGTSYEMIAPCDGFVQELRTTVQAAVTTGGPVTVEVNTVAVAGLSITVADAATKGTRQTATATAGSDTRKVVQGDRIEVVPDAAFATAGALNGYVLFSSADRKA